MPLGYITFPPLTFMPPLLSPLPSHHCNLTDIHRNFLQLLGMIIAVLVAVTFAYVPGVEGVLGTKAIPGIEWLYMLPFPLFLFAQDELRKYLIRRNPQGITFPSPSLLLPSPPFSSLLLPSPPFSSLLLPSPPFSSLLPPPFVFISFIFFIIFIHTSLGNIARYTYW